MPDPLYGTPDGFAALAAEADRRRVRSLTTACVASLLVAGVLGGVQSVRSRADGASHRLVSTPPDGATPAPEPGPGGVSVALPATGTSPLGPAVPGSGPVGRPGSSPAAVPTTTPGPHHPGPQSDPITRLPGYSTPSGFNRPCKIAYRTCSTTFSPSKGKDGRWTVAGMVCASTATASSLLFTAMPEVAFVVAAADGTEEWTSLDDHDAVEDPHGETLEAGRCVAYRTTWTGRHSDGTPFAPGSYSLGLATLTQESVMQIRTTFTMP